MNPVHIHLALNHLAVVGIPIALVLLLRGFLVDEIGYREWSYKFVVCLALITLVVYLTGEPTEDAVENLSTVSKKLIEPHEDAALISLILTLLSGVIALAGLFLKKAHTARLSIHKLLSLVLFLASGSLLFTALQGGKIHHEELRDATLQASADT